MPRPNRESKWERSRSSIDQLHGVDAYVDADPASAEVLSPRATQAVPQPQKGSSTQSSLELLTDALMMRSNRASGFCVG